MKQVSSMWIYVLWLPDWVLARLPQWVFDNVERAVFDGLTEREWIAAQVADALRATSRESPP